MAFKRLTKLPIEQVISAMADGTHTIRIEGAHVVGLQSNRLKTFLKGTKCVHCGLEGHYFSVEKQNKGSRWHLNLYHEGKDGRLTMMTSDHIIARAVGGVNGLDNRQPMCKPCNQTKAHYSSVEEGRRLHKPNKFKWVRKFLKDMFGRKRANKILYYGRCVRRKWLDFKGNFSAA
ncbi:MAG TPA: HNH endonuclease [Methanosarcina sp.]|nr:HNH endonuclease [Methanosarcina sp.]